MRVMCKHCSDARVRDIRPRFVLGVVDVAHLGVLGIRDERAVRLETNARRAREAVRLERRRLLALRLGEQWRRQVLVGVRAVPVRTHPHPLVVHAHAAQQLLQTLVRVRAEHVLLAVRLAPALGRCS